MIRALRLATLVAATFVIVENAICDDWQTGVGGNPARNGLSTARGPGIPMLLWHGGHAALISQQPVIGGNLVVTARAESLADRLHGTRLVGQELTTGEVLWEVELPVESPLTDSRVRVSAIHNGLVFATRAGDTNSASLYALSADDGSVVWRSEHKIDEGSTESPTFTRTGDLVIGNTTTLTRISRLDGTTVWRVPRRSPSSDGGSAAVFAGTVYAWEATPAGPRVSAFDAKSGERRYSTPGLNGGYSQQIGLMVGPGGMVYAPRAQGDPETDALIAFKDTGSGLEEKWRQPLGYVPFASLGIGPDGSVYSYTRRRQVVRFHPTSGAELGRTGILKTEVLQPRMAIGADGIIYLTNGGFAEGRLYSFNADLTERWSVRLPSVALGGPAIGQGGTLVVCGIGTDVRAYAPAESRCSADWNGNDTIDSQDFFDFIVAFFDEEADFNRDGLTNTQDLFAFLNAMIGGC